MRISDWSSDVCSSDLAIFVGDLVDRGPRSPDTLRIAKHMVDSGTGMAVVGNHDDKLKRHLDGRNVKVSHGLAETIEQFAQEPPEFRTEERSVGEGCLRTVRSRL